MLDLRCALLLPLIAGCAHTPAAPAVAPQPEEWDTEMPAGVRIASFDEEAPTHTPVRVVVDATREPVPGARIDVWWEANTPHAEPWSALLDESTLSDRDGWALVKAVEHAPWYFVEAPGWGSLGEMALRDEYELQPGEDFPLELRDWLDRPVPGATVELLLGCGHTAPVRSEFTDQDGRVMLRSVDPGEGYLWLLAEGLAGYNDGYDGGWDELPVEGGQAVLRAEPAPVVEGVLLNGDGTPAAGIAVGVHDTHRGPWTATGPDGRFRLLGAPAYSEVSVRSDGEDRAFFQSVPGVFQTVRLGGQPEQTTAELTVWLSVEGGPPTESVRVVAISDANGRAELDWAEFDADAGGTRAEFDLTPGPWTVRVGSPEGRFRQTDHAVEVGAAETNVALQMTENPVWRPRVFTRAVDGTTTELSNQSEGSFHVVTAEGREEATPSALFEDAIHVPASGPFVVEYESDDESIARVRFEAPPSGLGPALTLLPVYTLVDDSEELMSVPYGGDYPEARLTVLLPDGTPAARAKATISGSHSSNVRYRQHVRLDSEGALDFAFRRHDRFEVNVDDLPPLVAHIDQPGPWTLQWPTTTVEVRALDESGAPLEDFAVTLGPSEEVESEGGVAMLRAVPAGPLRFWVESPGRLGRAVRLVVRDGEPRRFTTTLRTGH